ncbi:hypothetical protein SAMD00019534_096930 [Acytostelium subglobosum LB1]|uniref:hypothetical protein n=1 Tax=Acytostelium subglobosum LB1 TaxID=1410327 RepID=UPI000644867D|nr:hypothetical protein SAMD00019534_096930 [Acytostelium subglobosum LB1]GAM26518.1 hypothetical protein SAMD00019534_096930 [Acytostelium subglobosum LB1]|eukprot:XP_012750614.1 hypothetical protein SAMD00019534_096930 [Acytostelium subglobosum LB1]
MGGQPRYPYPTTVWTPAGGWWCEYPKNCKKNGVKTSIALFGILSLAFITSKMIERRYSHTPPPAITGSHGHH